MFYFRNRLKGARDIKTTDADGLKKGKIFQFRINKKRNGGGLRTEGRV